jgi:hypothetical protein
LGLSIWLHSLPMHLLWFWGLCEVGIDLEVHSTVIYKITLDLGPSLRFESLFHPHSSVSTILFHETGYQFTRFAGSYSHKAWFTERNIRQRWRCKWGKSKTRGESSLKTNLVEKTSLVPPFFWVLCTIFIDIINYQSFFNI